MKKIYCILSISLALCLAAAAHSNQDNIPPVALKHFTNGLLAEMGGDFDGAMASYLIAETFIPDNPELILTIAELYLKMKEPEMAYKKYQQLLTINPGNREYHYGAGEAAYLMKDYEEAADQFKWVITKGQATYYVRLKYIISLLNLNKYRKALRQLEDLGHDYPDNPEPFSLTGDVHLYQKNYDKAIESFYAAIAVDSTYARAYIGLAESFKALDMPDSTAAAYERYISLNPEDIKTYRSWLYQLIENEDFTRALAASKSYLDIIPNDWIILRNTAFLAFYEDDCESAIEYFERLLDWDPTDREARILYARALLEAGMAKESIAQFELILDQERDPEGIIYLAMALNEIDSSEKALKVITQGEGEFALNADIPFYRGVILTKLGDYEEAKEHFRRALELDPYHKDALFSLGDAMERTGQRDSAIAIFQDLIEEYPNDPLIMNYLGYIFVEAGRDLDYADSLICSALALEPDNPAYIDSYGWLLYKRGDYELALEHLLRAEKLAEPMDPVILEHIGQLYEKLNNKRLAIEYYERALELNPSMETSYERLKFLK